MVVVVEAKMSARTSPVDRSEMPSISRGLALLLYCRIALDKRHGKVVVSFCCVFKVGRIRTEAVQNRKVAPRSLSDLTATSRPNSPLNLLA